MKKTVYKACIIAALICIKSSLLQAQSQVRIPIAYNQNDIHVQCMSWINMGNT